jgi:starch synthase
VGGIPEIVEDNVTGKLVPPQNSEQLATAIVELLKNGKKREEISENIRNKFMKSEFSWDVIAERTIEIYKKVLIKSYIQKNEVTNE